MDVTCATCVSDVGVTCHCVLGGRKEWVMCIVCLACVKTRVYITYCVPTAPSDSEVQGPDCQHSQRDEVGWRNVVWRVCVQYAAGSCTSGLHNNRTLCERCVEQALLWHA